MWVYLIVAFNLGLFSSLHCIGMCGGFISTLMLATSDSNKGEKKKILRSSFAFNSGRITSYSIAGLIMGIFGFALAEAVSKNHVYLVLQIIASLILIGIALSILGVFPFSQRLESIGARLWKHIQPLGKGLLPIDNSGKAFLFGMIWGWLPCGMVYSALLYSLTTGSALNGMLTMFVFGLGTLPAMVSAGYFVDYLNRFRQHKQLRWLTAIVLILIAVTLPLSMKLMSGHQHQTQNDNASNMEHTQKQTTEDHSMHMHH